MVAGDGIVIPAEQGEGSRQIVSWQPVLTGYHVTERTPSGNLPRIMARFKFDSIFLSFICLFGMVLVLVGLSVC